MKLHPIYTTRGEHSAYYGEGYLFNVLGEWIGFVDARTGNVYSVAGDYVGYINRDGRILRKRAVDDLIPNHPRPPKPPRPTLPATVPLPPMFSELNFDTIDILDEMPERLHTADAGELRPDMD